jgi:hypothetical protein
MGAETKIKVRVIRTHEDVIEVSAVTLAEAEAIAMREPDVAHVIEAFYPDEEGGC